MNHEVKDLIIVGAGPAGLMAAKTAAELGLKVMVIEKYKDFNKLRRACSTQFIMDDGYEGECLEIGDNKLIFKRNQFQVPYTGKLVEVKNKYYHSPKGHRIHFALPEEKAFALKFDKCKLLNDLYEACKALDVTFKMDTIATGGQDNGNQVDVELKHNETQEIVSGKKLIIAEGVNARLCSVFGLNENRIHFATAQTVKYFLSGVKGIEPNSWNLYYGKAYHSNTPVIIGPSMIGNEVVEMTLTGDRNVKPTEVYQKLVADSPLSEMLSKACIIKQSGCPVKAFSSMQTPYKQNVIAIGDSAAFVEVEVQGALMCGYQAAHSIVKELNGGNGFEAYTKWWRDSFEFNSEDHLRVSQGYALVPTYTDDELDYLFGLIEDLCLEGTYSQYKTPKLIWDSILMHQKQIEDEAPQIYSKIQNMNQLTLADTLSK